MSLDPAWSPDGRSLAYVKAPVYGLSSQPPLGWFNDHKLFVFNSSTGRSTEISGVDGVSVPTWSQNGKYVLYVRGDSLWLSRATGGKAVEVETPLFLPALWRSIGNSSDLSYYGQVDWGAQFNWWSH